MFNFLITFTVLNTRARNIWAMSVTVDRMLTMVNSCCLQVKMYVFSEHEFKK
jgi:hypothetical protein